MSTDNKNNPPSTFHQPPTNSVPISFVWKHGATQSVYVSGSFNKWANKIPLQAVRQQTDRNGPSQEDIRNAFMSVEHQTMLSEDLEKNKGVTEKWVKLWQLTLFIPPGKYYFKYIVDGQWRHDPLFVSGPDPAGNIVNMLIIHHQQPASHAPATGSTSISSTSPASNNIISSGSPSSSSTSNQTSSPSVPATSSGTPQPQSQLSASNQSASAPQEQKQQSSVVSTASPSSTSTASSSTAAGTPVASGVPAVPSYGQVVPPLDVYASHSKSNPAPVVLPLQLKNVLLAKERPPHTDPFLMHMPDHVVFNHLYVSTQRRRLSQLPFTTLYPQSRLAAEKGGTASLSPSSSDDFVFTPVLIGSSLMMGITQRLRKKFATVVLYSAPTNRASDVEKKMCDRSAFYLEMIGKHKKQKQQDAEQVII